MSILLRPTPAHAVHRVLIGTAVRKPPEVLSAYLESLAWQEWPEQVQPSYCFVADTEDADALDLLHRFVAIHGGEVVTPAVGPQDFADDHPVTHQWQPSAMARVGQHKNRILAKAVSERYDYIWLVDADLILDRTTFASLWHCKAPIACAVYWTHWHNPGVQQGQLHAAPQVWLTHPYGLEGRGYDSAEFRRKLIQKERIQVWGQGACTLLKTEVVEKGVTFDYLPGAPTDGMMAGEDRHFCLRAESLHLPMMADPWPDIFHVYHREDRAKIADMQYRLGAVHPGSPEIGDWVSLVLEPLEPAPVGPNQFVALPPTFARGRFGALAMLPEMEERIADMTRGETSVVGVHFPIHHPAVWLRGQRRLVRVTLVDCKRYAFPPVIEDELLRGTTTGAMADRVTLSAEQQRAMDQDRQMEPV